MTEDERPLSELSLEELRDRLQIYRARRAQPRGTSASRTPGVIGPGETTARRAGGRKTMAEEEVTDIAARILARRAAEAAGKEGPDA